MIVSSQQDAFITQGPTALLLLGTLLYSIYTPANGATVPVFKCQILFCARTFFGHLHETDHRTKTARKRGEIEQLVLFACELLLMSSRAEALLSVCRQRESQRSASSLGSTGRMRFPNEES